jgi:predicted glycosyltransferase
MRILIDISHPAHVHFFRNAIKIWADRGHGVYIASRRKDLALDLLDAYGLPNKCLSRAGRGKRRLLSELLIHESRLLRETMQFKPDIMLQIGGLFISHVGRACGIPTITFTDTEMATLSNALTFPFTSAVVTPACYEGRVPPSRHYLYHGYHELAYLHPNLFTPDPEVLQRLGLAEGESFFIVRFVSWGAAHDVGESGFKLPVKIEMVQELARYGRVFITSEGKLPRELEAFRFPIAPELIHHAMAFARLCIGESATMASESAILGTPAIFVSTSPRGYTTEQEKTYDMVYTFSHVQQAEALAKMRELLAIGNIREKWQQKRRRLLEDKIDVTDWLVRLVEGYPDSLAVLCMRPGDVR